MGTYRFDGQSYRRWQKSKARKGRAPTTLETSEDRSMSNKPDVIAILKRALEINND
jgi:hypothetical protein